MLAHPGQIPAAALLMTLICAGILLVMFGAIRLVSDLDRTLHGKASVAVGAGAVALGLALFLIGADRASAMIL